MNKKEVKYHLKITRHSSIDTELLINLGILVIYDNLLTKALKYFFFVKMGLYMLSNCISKFYTRSLETPHLGEESGEVVGVKIFYFA